VTISTDGYMCIRCGKPAHYILRGYRPGPGGTESFDFLQCGQCATRFWRRADAESTNKQTGKGGDYVTKNRTLLDALEAGDFDFDDLAMLTISILGALEHRDRQFAQAAARVTTGGSEKEEIDRLHTKLGSYVAEYNDLEEKVERLREQNSAVVAENTRLQLQVRNLGDAVNKNLQAFCETQNELHLAQGEIAQRDCIIKEQQEKLAERQKWIDENCSRNDASNWVALHAVRDAGRLAGYQTTDIDEILKKLLDDRRQAVQSCDVKGNEILHADQRLAEARTEIANLVRDRDGLRNLVDKYRNEKVAQQTDHEEQVKVLVAARDAAIMECANHLPLVSAVRSGEKRLWGCIAYPDVVAAVTHIIDQAGRFDEDRGKMAALERDREALRLAVNDLKRETSQQQTSIARLQKDVENYSLNYIAKSRLEWLEKKLTEASGEIGDLRGWKHDQVKTINEAQTLLWGCIKYPAGDALARIITQAQSG
jgi:chromosome segregation ATPase